MGRGKKGAESCAHVSPVVVEPAPKGRVARCLVCGSVGPARPSSKWALAALRDEARRSSREAG
ncbi:MAG: hypothetical protein M3N18_01850 [Actinomycetota bacterium]|nr:hypothetical protein [Actinomycetota bacterium]